MERFTEKAKNITYLNKFAKIIARGNLTNQFVADPHSITYFWMNTYKKINFKISKYYINISWLGNIIKKKNIYK